MKKPIKKKIPNGLNSKVGKVYPKPAKIFKIGDDGSQYF